ncbi:hypothetical protein [Caulobacter radicis]|uniref:hypothetical protein n=1 Tax=Caulobacter radicis TaxID=2172650 RepID=UPI00140423A2|nr:hypothetical protein [Caulobacter radicis]
MARFLLLKFEAAPAARVSPAPVERKDDTGGVRTAPARKAAPARKRDGEHHAHQ